MSCLWISSCLLTVAIIAASLSTFESSAPVKPAVSSAISFDIFFSLLYISSISSLPLTSGGAIVICLSNLPRSK